MNWSSSIHICHKTEMSGYFPAKTMMSPSSDKNAAIEASGESTIEGATKKAQEEIDSLFNVTLNIAVTGETGCGKSTFINAIRDLNDDDEGAAKTGVTETTTEPTPYQNPKMPNVTFWDLPGIVSTKFKAKKYLKDVQFKRYDFFLIISSERFKENDIMLAKQIRKMKKQFYFIRSKIDNDIRAEGNKKDFNREVTLSQIKRYCEENLKELGNPKVFLISSKTISAFGFEELVNTLISELPQHKRAALLQTVPVSSVAILEEKVKMFEKVIWALAIASAGIAVIPVPGLSASSDLAMVTSFFKKCYYSFGLDDKSLKNLAERVNKPHLMDLRMSPLVAELVKTSTLRMGASGLVEFLCSLVPGVGSAAAAVISFRTTRDLQHGLKELADTARTVLREAGLEK